MTEMATQVAFQVICFDQAIAMAAASGQLELNAFLPLVAFNLLSGLRMLRRCVSSSVRGASIWSRPMPSDAGGGWR